MWSLKNNTTSRGSSVTKDYAALRNQALANFEALLNLWRIEWKKISEYEYDFKNPNRDDKNFGACRFNVLKNIGSDFASPTFSDADYLLLGPGFNKNDFGPVSTDGQERRSGFDIIGLTQRLYKLATYREAAKLLQKYIEILEATGEAQSEEIVKIREQTVAAQRLLLIKRAAKTWEYCKPIRGTIGEKYFINRGIEGTIDEPNVRFHEKIKNKEINGFLPGIIFKVTTAPDRELVALHRIYLDKSGEKKANVRNPKMAMGPIKGSGIWLGTPGPKLYIAEGPENALTLKQHGCDFVVSTVFATNYSTLVIPECVELVVLAIDNDPAGLDNAKKAAKEYAYVQKIPVKLIAFKSGAIPE